MDELKFCKIGMYVCILIFIVMQVLSFTGVPYKTTVGGQHVGYITAVEDNGLIWKTTTAYVKSSLESTQEDKYCVIDENLKIILKGASSEKRRVQLSYYDELILPVTDCNGEQGVINNIKILTGE